jgi:cyanophycin synthetase
VAAEYFDEVLIWQDEDYARGRDSREVRSLIVEGARGNSKERLIQVIQTEDDAVDQALQKARANSIICIFTGRIEAMTAKIKGLQEGELDLTISKEDIPNITFADDASM